jgi:hypothetical protein
MLAKVTSCAIVGLEGALIEVEVVTLATRSKNVPAPSQWSKPIKRKYPAH